QELRAADRLVRDHEQPLLTRRMRRRRLLLRGGPVPARGEPPADQDPRLEDEDHEPGPRVDERRNCDQAEVPDRAPQEMKCRRFGPKRVLHTWRKSTCRSPRSRSRWT